MAILTLLKQNDTAPPYTATLKDADGVAVNISGATLLFLMRKKGGSVKVNAAADIVSAVLGTISYTWAADDLDTVGEFEVEIQVTFSGGTVRTFPSDGYNRIIITDDIA